MYTSQYNTPKTQDVGYYVDQTARTCLNRCLCALCHHLVSDYTHRLPIIYHHGHPPRWTADHISSTVARQVGGVRADLPMNQVAYLKINNVGGDPVSLDIVHRDLLPSSTTSDSVSRSNSWLHTTELGLLRQHVSHNN